MENSEFLIPKQTEDSNDEFLIPKQEDFLIPKQDDTPVRNWLKSFYPANGKQDVNKIEITPQLRARYERSKTAIPEAQPSNEYLKTGVMSDFSSGLGSDIAKSPNDIVGGVAGAGAGVADFLAQLAKTQMTPNQKNWVEQKIQKPLGTFKAGTEILKDEYGMKPSVGKMALGSAAQMAVDIPAKYAWAGPAFPLVMALEGALSAGDNRKASDYAKSILEDKGTVLPDDKRAAITKIKDILAGGGKEGIKGLALQGLGKLTAPLPKVIQPVAEGAGMYGLSALEGGNTEENIAAGMLGVGMKLSGLREKEKQPDAKFIGMQKDPDGPSIPLFNVTKKGHPSEGSAVTAETLKKNNLIIPEIPIKQVQPTVPKESLQNAPGSKVINTPASLEGPNMGNGPFKKVSHGGDNEGKVGIEVLNRNSEVILDKNLTPTYVGSEGDKGIADIKPGETAYRRNKKTDKWEEFGRGRTMEVADEKLIKALDIAKPKPSEQKLKTFVAKKDITLPAEDGQPGNVEIPKGETWFIEDTADPKFKEIHDGEKRLVKTNTLPGAKEKSESTDFTPEELASFGKKEIPTSKKILEEQKIETPKPPTVISEVRQIEPKFAPNRHNVKLEQKAIDKGLVGKSGEIAEHLVYDRAEQERMASDIRNTDIDKWKRIATGQEDVPDMVGADGVKLMGSSVFKDATKWAAKNKDIPFIRELVKSAPKSISRAGQELNVLSEKDMENPVVAIKDINNTIVEANKIRKEKPEIAKIEDNRLRNAKGKLNTKIIKSEEQRKIISEKIRKTKEFNFENKIKTDPKYREEFILELNRVRDELNKKPEYSDFKIDKYATLNDVVTAWKAKRTGKYRDIQEKRLVKLTEKILNTEFETDPKYKTWIDKQTKGIKEDVDRLSKTYNKLKEINDRRTTGVSDAEAEKIIELSDRVSQSKQLLDTGGDRLEYGRAWVDFHEYINDLKLRATKQTFREAIRQPGGLVVKAAGISKAIKAAFDNSYIFRQGLKAALRPATHKIWRENAAKSFGWAWKQFGGKHVMREIMADIVSRPNYLNGKMTKANLSFGNPEEPFPSAIPESIPFFGKIYKASETAYAGQAYKNRADIFDKMLEIAEKSKSPVDTTNKVQLQSIGRLVNSMTGRGHIGKLEKNAELVNNVFFSLRYLKSNLDYLTMHQGQGETGFVKKQAALNLLSGIMGTAAILGIAKALKPDSVDFDSRGANFGKIRIGNTRFDITGGAASLIILASRLLTQQTKSSTSGKISDLNTGKFGSMTTKDVIYSFFEGKTSPALSVALDIAQARDKFTRKKPTVWGLVKNLTFPMPIQNAEELLKDPDSAPVILGIIMDGLGVSTNTYGKKQSPKYKLDQSKLNMDWDKLINKK